MRGWARDLALGARFALAGGRSGWTRTALTAFGVGLGVVVLLLATAVPNVLTTLDARGENREPSCMNDYVACYETEPGADTLLYLQEFTEYHGTEVRGALLQPEAGASSTATPPPGVDAFPAPGEMLVSPALGRLLDSEEGALLAERLDHEPVGTIGDEGLVGPADLFYYAGADHLELVPEGAVMRVDEFGRDWADEELNAPLLLLVSVICVALLMPVAVFVATAVRLGGERRDRRLAALRLVGADAMTTRRIAAGEALVGALAGLLLGCLGFLPLRELLGGVTVSGSSVFPSDIAPSGALVALILLGVPGSAVAVTLFALRGVAIEPLGVVRRAPSRRRRLAWRLLPVLLGPAMLVPLAGSFTTGDDLALAQAVVGMVLLLVGVTLLLPWMVERLVGRLRGGPLSWQLAIRRLQLSGGPAARAVSGITVAVAGATALYMLFSGVRAEETQETGRDPDAYQVEVLGYELDRAEDQRFAGEIEAVPGVTEAFSLAVGWGEILREDAGTVGDPATQVVVGDCATLSLLAEIGDCANGDSFLVRAPEDAEYDTVQPGDRLYLGDRPSESGGHWTVPDSAREVPLPDDEQFSAYASGVFATPAALDAAVLGDAETRALVRIDPAAGRDVIERIRNVAWAYESRPSVWEVTSEDVSSQFRNIQLGLLVGACGVLLLIGASMVVTTLEQLRERRRLLSVLVAFGTRRSTLGASVLWQTAIPVTLGLALASGVGLGLGALLMTMVHLPVSGWLAFLPMAAAGGGLIAFVTLVSLPFLWRLMRPDGLRTE
ncbi:FtsX-like permease family protein [Streptomyces sp. B6B3]|uniref:FtsX-like permease family protein n=1 Tax=Streptomyces sp. B6B3 TaxID=3153570 RepID=UPI00325E7A19